MNNICTAKSTWIINDSYNSQYSWMIRVTSMHNNNINNHNNYKNCNGNDNNRIINSMVFATAMYLYAI